MGRLTYIGGAWSELYSRPFKAKLRNRAHILQPALYDNRLGFRAFLSPVRSIFTKPILENP